MQQLTGIWTGCWCNKLECYNVCTCMLRMIEGHIRLDSEFNREAAMTLCNRGVEKAGTGGYKFTRDLRAKIVRQLARH